MLRLKQATDSLELISDSTKSSKVEALKELLESICVEGNKVVIFTFFKKMALILMRELAEYKPLLIAGGVSQEERTANRDAFNDNTENRIMIMTEAGSFGLNLQKKATSVVHYDLPWSITKTEQREDRVHRIGQTGNVTVYRMLAKDSIDEYNLKVVQVKQRTAERVLGDEDKLRKSRVSRALLQKILE
jgi:SNF2 family DNA or RNA helicase